MDVGPAKMDFQRLLERLESLQQAFDEQQRTIDRQKQTIQRLTAEVDRLRQRLTQYEPEVSRESTPRGPDGETQSAHYSLQAE